MKKISLLHTVHSVYESFPRQLKLAFPSLELKLTNTLDEFPTMSEERLALLLKAKDLDGADLIIVTCSTLTPMVTRLRHDMKTRMVAIDDAMAEAAVLAGTRIAVLATAVSAYEPCQMNLRSKGSKAVSGFLAEPAFQALQQGDKSKHDALLLQAARGIQDVDVIVLAQASMAHMEKEIEEVSGIPTLSSPRLCLEQVGKILAKG